MYNETAALHSQAFTRESVGLCELGLVARDDRRQPLDLNGGRKFLGLRLPPFRRCPPFRENSVDRQSARGAGSFLDWLSCTSVVQLLLIAKEPTIKVYFSGYPLHLPWQFCYSPGGRNNATDMRRCCMRHRLASLIFGIEIPSLI